MILLNKEELENIKEDLIEEILTLIKIGMDFLDIIQLVTILTDSTELIQLLSELFNTAKLFYFILSFF